MMEHLHTLALLDALEKQISTLPSINGLVMRDYVLEIVRMHIRFLEEEFDKEFEKEFAQHAQRQARH